LGDVDVFSAGKKRPRKGERKVGERRKGKKVRRKGRYPSSKVFQKMMTGGRRYHSEKLGQTRGSGSMTRREILPKGKKGKAIGAINNANMHTTTGQWGTSGVGGSF